MPLFAKRQCDRTLLQVKEPMATVWEILDVEVHGVAAEMEFDALDLEAEAEAEEEVDEWVEEPVEGELDSYLKVDGTR